MDQDRQSTRLRYFIFNFVRTPIFGLDIYIYTFIEELIRKNLSRVPQIEIIQIPSKFFSLSIL